MSEMLLEFQGSGTTGLLGKITLYEDKIVISKNMVEGVDVTIYLEQITSIQIASPGLLYPGFIRFVLPGTITERNYHWQDAKKDKHALTFIKKQDVSLAKKLQEKIEELKHNINKPNALQPQLSLADEIRKYKQLLDEGILTEEEFTKKKKDILG